MIAPRRTIPGAAPRRPRVLGAFAAGVLAWLCLSYGVSASARDASTTYLLKCSGCHGANATGSERGGIPALNGYVGSFARLESGRRYIVHVPGVATSGLDDAELASVMNYVFERWSDAPASDPVEPFTAAEVARLRAQPVGDVVQYRRAVVRQLDARELPVADYPWP